MLLKSALFKYLFTFIILASCISCNSDTGRQSVEEVVEDTVFETVNDPGLDSARVIKNAPFLWTADFEESTNTFKIHKPTAASIDTLSGEKMIALINTQWDSVHLNFIKASHDTVYVAVPQSTYLTQQLGSTGAENYMATTTFSLTEMKGIRYVNFRFIEGDHASPGVYSRNDFKNFK